MKKLYILALAFVLILAACTPAPSSSAQVSSSVAVGSAPLQSQSVQSLLPQVLPPQQPVSMRIAGLKGPTSMGMVKMMNAAQSSENFHDYQFTIEGSPDAIVPKLVSGQLDIAAIPANLASILYNSTGGAVQVAAINTLGVLYVVENWPSIKSIQDLRGKTIYSTGKGTTPEFALRYILLQNGIDPDKDVSIEYKSESTEIAAMLNSREEIIAVLPQPYVTAVIAQNSRVRIALDLNNEWENVSDEREMITGVLVVRTEFLRQNAQAFFNDFLPDYQASIAWVQENVEDAAQLVAQYGIVDKPAIAQTALPACNLTYIDGQDMQASLAAYLAVLHEQNPASVGGAMPGDDFYAMRPGA